MAKLLLLSNSTNAGSSYLEHAREALLDFLAGVEELLFIPFALADHDRYTAKTAAAFRPLGIRVQGLHAAADATAAIHNAQAVFAGGGNTFRLLKALQDQDLIAPLREAVASGTRYSGASAGSNVAAPTIRTTNDMPIVQPDSLDALGLVPFQINPHYLDPEPDSQHAGETREQRISEFLEENDVDVLGLREGVYLYVDNGSAHIGGVAVQPEAPGPAIIFRRYAAPAEIAGDVSWLLSLAPRFDTDGVIG
jgi:dipeptidase E